MQNQISVTFFNRPTTISAETCFFPTQFLLDRAFSKLDKMCCWLSDRQCIQKIRIGPKKIRKYGNRKDDRTTRYGCVDMINGRKVFFLFIGHKINSNHFTFQPDIDNWIFKLFYKGSFVLFLMGSMVGILRNIHILRQSNGWG